MALDPKTLANVTQYLIIRRHEEAVRLSEIHEWVKNRIVDIYIPEKTNHEYRKIVETSRWNILPKLIDNGANSLFIDGYRAARQKKNKPVWDNVWQPNRMDARQAGLWRPTLEFGTGYATVLPGDINGKKSAVITPWSPRRLTALYADAINDEWPQYAMTVGTSRPVFSADGTNLVTPVVVYDANNKYEIELDSTLLQTRTYQVFGQVQQTFIPDISVNVEGARVSEHGMGVVPVVRFMQTMGELDDGPEGVVFPMLPVQRQINQTTFSLRMAELYAAFKQRYVTGLPIQEDENGNPIEPFNVAVDRLLQAEDLDTKFGEFSQTELKGYLDSRDKTMLFASSVRNIPPHQLVVGDSVSNVSAEALAALQDAHGQDVDAMRTSLGESAEQMFRLAGKAMGDDAAWEDTSSQVRWRDTTPRSLAQIADALGKLAQMLEVPPRALWERIPDVTDQDLELWEELAKESDSIAKLEGLMNNAQPRRQPANPAASRTPGGNRTRREPAAAGAGVAG